MSESATDRRLETALRIADHAQVLTDERGLDGFTMDDLATAAGVSRRTLFNYFPGKLDAVLGPWPELGDEQLEEFRAGGPHGDLVDDLRALIRMLMDTKGVERERLTRFRRMLTANPRLKLAVHEKYEALSAQIVEEIIRREGETFDVRRARIAVNLLAALFDIGLDEYVDDPSGRPIGTHVDDAIATARSLLGA